MLLSVHQCSIVIVSHLFVYLFRYGFAIGNVAAFDMSDQNSIVSPGGVGFDINCGVRMIRTNLMEDQVGPLKEELCEALYKAIPVGVGEGCSVKLNKQELDQILVCFSPILQKSQKCSLYF
jgi:RNA-splicing ligase RtcB